MRITRLKIQNIRAIESMDLRISPLTVLIGENGSGKSTVLECLEILRKAAQANFLRELTEVHGGPYHLFRSGSEVAEIEATFQGEDSRIQYRLELIKAPPIISREEIHVFEESLSHLAQRAGTTAIYWNPDSGQTTGTLSHHETLLSTFKSNGQREAPRSGAGLGCHLVTYLQEARIHGSFDTLASWLARASGAAESLRAPRQLDYTERLSRRAENLASVWHHLRQRPKGSWESALDALRLGLGDHISDVVTPAVPGGGYVNLGLRTDGMEEPIPVSGLSDGQLSWLALVALGELTKEQGGLLALDEPERHLHPHLIGVLMRMLADLSDYSTVILSTHSDALLSCLENAAESVRVCQLEGSRATAQELDPEALSAWLEEYGSVGELRASGLLTAALSDAGESQAS